MKGQREFSLPALLSGACVGGQWNGHEYNKWSSPTSLVILVAHLSSLLSIMPTLLPDATVPQLQNWITLLIMALAPIYSEVLCAMQSI